MNNKIFNKDYNQYWKKSIEETLVDGTKVPGDEIIYKLIESLNINAHESVLDLGCGFGRLFPNLIKFTKKVYGIDIDMSMVNDASNYEYISLHQSTAEETRYPDKFFDKVVSLGVFDVVNQEQAISELNRILRVGGVCMFTGKNINYYEDDTVAFIAERNAKLKQFPNKFTDVKLFISNLSQFGFKLERLLVFKRRGDFGLNIFEEISSDTFEGEFYEFSIYLKKYESISTPPSITITSPYSNTAIKKCNESNEDKLFEIFKSLFEIEIDKSKCLD